MRPVLGMRNQGTPAGTATVTVARPPAIRLGRRSHLVKDVATPDGLRAAISDLKRALGDKIRIQTSDSGLTSPPTGSCDAGRSPRRGGLDDLPGLGHPG